MANPSLQTPAPALDPLAIAISVPPAPSVPIIARPRPTSFEQLAAQPDEHLDVALGAALIARDAHHWLDVERCLARFDELAAPLMGRELCSCRPRSRPT